MSKPGTNDLPKDAGTAAGGGGDLKKKDILRIIEENSDTLRNYGVRKLGLFGSFARDEATKDSDIDLVVELEVKSYRTYIRLKFFLEDLFKRAIDLVTDESIKPGVRPYIEQEVIYGKGL